jgi:Carboxypeptidase regulatory-like domain
MKRLGRVLLFFWVTAAAVTTLQAQNSQVSGQIRDTSQAAVSGVKVTLTRVETGDHREATSGTEGYYSFPLLVPGHYDLKVEKAGFETQSQTGIVVLTGSVSSVDVDLKVGSETQTVNVDASVPLLQTESAAVANVVENESITNMPLIDRRSSQLQRLSGFAVQTNSGANASFSIAGSRSNNADYTIDGGTAQNLLQGVAILIFDPPVESVQEFNLSTSTYNAELGRSGGAVVQMTTKSGTNSFHGSAYEYLRNDALQATPENPTPGHAVPKNPILRYNLFGASLGGPIKKNKTQFFFNYEGLRQNQGTPQTLIVPNALTLTGNFNGIIDPKTGQQVVIKDPTTGSTFADNQIPADRLDPVGLKLAALYPQVDAGTNPTGLFAVNVPQKTVRDAYVTRIDHVFSQKDRIFGRLLAQADNIVQSSVFPTPGTDRWGYTQHDYSYNASGNWFHNFGPNLINELRLTYTRRQFLYISAGAHTSLDNQIGLNTFDNTYFPTITLGGGSLEWLGNTTQQERLQTPVNSNAYVDNLSWVHGRHQFKFGAELRTSNNTDRFRPLGGGSFTFNNNGASTNVAVGSLENLLLGNVWASSINEFYTIKSFAYSWGVFVQDDWKLTPHLTVNLGLRWDLDSPRYTDPSAQNSFNPTAINPVSGTPGVVTFSGLNRESKYAHNFDTNNFGPRVGFAWSPSDHWVIRGGGGVLYTGEYDSATPTVANLGYGTTGALQGSLNTNTGVLTPAFEVSSIPTFWVSPTRADLTPGFGAVAPTVVNPDPLKDRWAPTTAVQYFTKNHVNGYIYQASFGIQRQLTSTLLLDLSYLGTFGHSLPVTNNAGGQYSINQISPDNLLLLKNDTTKTYQGQALRPFPQFQNVQLLDPNIAASKYNGANIGIQKRYGQGLQFQANYTWSKFLDNADGRSELAGYPGDNAYTDYYNPKARWGRSGSDVTHRFIVSTLYELPFGKGKKFAPGSRVLDEVIRGWTVGTIAELHTGTALSPLDANNNTFSFSDGVRPNLVGNPNRGSCPTPSGGSIPVGTPGCWFNTSAFAQNDNYTFGNAPRTFGSGPGTVQVDASLLKNFRLFEGTALQFRAEAINVLNHPNWANPVTLWGNPRFGQVTGLQAGNNQSRVLQLALHLSF